MHHTRQKSRGAGHVEIMSDKEVFSIRYHLLIDLKLLPRHVYDYYVQGDVHNFQIISSLSTELVTVAVKGLNFSINQPSTPLRTLCTSLTDDLLEVSFTKISLTLLIIYK